MLKNLKNIYVEKKPVKFYHFTILQLKKIPQKIVVSFAIVKISDIFSAYFFVNFCLKIWKNYTRWKKSQNFTVVITIAIFLRNFAHFSVKNFALCKKNHVFLRKILQKNIQCKNYRKSFRKNLRKNKRKTSQSPYSNQKNFMW